MTYTEFLARWNDETDPEINALKQGGMKAIRAKAGLTQVRFAEAYGVPRRTTQAREAGIATMPEYEACLLAYAVLNK